MKIKLIKVTGDMRSPEVVEWDQTEIENLLRTATLNTRYNLGINLKPRFSIVLGLEIDYHIWLSDITSNTELSIALYRRLVNANRYSNHWPAIYDLLLSSVPSEIKFMDL